MKKWEEMTYDERKEFVDNLSAEETVELLFVITEKIKDCKQQNSIICVE